MHVRLARHTRRLVASLLLFAAPAVAQEPAILAYAPGLTGTGYWVDPGSPVGIGFLFRPVGSIAVTGLSFFNPTGARAGGTGVTPAASYTVSLMALTQVRFDTFAGTVIAQTAVSSSSMARVAPSGPSGVFWTTPLAMPLQLSPGTVYGVFAAPNGGGYPFYGVGHIVPPLSPAVVGWMGDAAALGNEVLRSDATSATGASFEFVQTVPEPAAASLLAPAALALAWIARRRTRHRRI